MDDDGRDRRRALRPVRVPPRAHVEVVVMISASALKPNCAYPNVLKKLKQPTPEQQGAIDRGTHFHAAVELWLKGGRLPEVNDAEVQGWIDLLASVWRPLPENAHTEIAWGLSPDGDHVMVAEPRPHCYEAMNGAELLTAGRADVCWITGTVSLGRILTVIDFKTGKWPVPVADENLQVNAAGIALMQRFGCDGYLPGIYYARDGHFDWGDSIVMRNSVGHL